MTGLYARPNGERALEDRLCGLVFVVPRLELVTKEELDAPDVHLPRRIQSSVVDVRQATDGGGEVAGESNGSIEHVPVSFRKPVCRGRTFNLQVPSKEVQHSGYRVLVATPTLSQNVPLFLLKT